MEMMKAVHNSVQRTNKPFGTMSFVSWTWTIIKTLLCFVSLNNLGFCSPPTVSPTSLPSKSPSGMPSFAPSTDPSGSPTENPSANPSGSPPTQKTCTPPPSTVSPGQRICGDCINSSTTPAGAPGPSGYFLSYLACRCGFRLSTGGCSDATNYCFENARSNIAVNQGGACIDRRRSLSLNPLLHSLDGDQDPKRAMKLFGFVRVPRREAPVRLQSVALVSHHRYDLPKALMMFLSQAKDVYNWSELYSQGTTNQNESRQQQQSSVSTSCGRSTNLSGSSQCIFGHFSDESSKQLRLPKESSEDEEEPATRYMNNRCPHIPHSRMVKAWNKSISEWESPPTTDFRLARRELPKLELESFTMVRDPFDRLVSYFYYLRGFTETNEFLKHTVSEEQYEKVKQNDLKGWLELLYVQDGGCGLEMPNQYPYVHEDIDTAMEMIRVDAAESPITVLLTECYEASLHLLANAVHGLDPASVQPFIASPEYKSNPNKKYDERPSKAELMELRRLAEQWFADDFAFYDTAVEEFLVLLKHSYLDPSILRTCKYWTEDEEAGISPHLSNR